MAVATGTVEAVRRDAKGLKLAGKEEWFTSYFPMKNPPRRGDEISFEYVVKESGGRSYHNIKGEISNGSGADLASVSVSTSSRPGHYVSTSSPAPKATDWPIPSDSARDRSIIRQSSLKVALDFARIHGSDRGSEFSAEEVVQVARYFESYCTGDLDVEELAGMVSNLDHDPDLLEDAI